jgi:hypothetical protein
VAHALLQVACMTKLLTINSTLLGRVTGGAMPQRLHPAFENDLLLWLQAQGKRQMEQQPRSK